MATPGSLRRTAAHIGENAVLPEPPQAPSTAHTTGVAVARTRSQNSSTCSRRPSVSLLYGSSGSATNSPARAFIGSSGGDSSSRPRALTSLYARTRGALIATPRTNPTTATNPTSITFPGCEVSHGCAGPSHGKATAANRAPSPPQNIAQVAVPPKVTRSGVPKPRSPPWRKASEPSTMTTIAAVASNARLERTGSKCPAQVAQASETPTRTPEYRPTNNNFRPAALIRSSMLRSSVHFVVARSFFLPAASTGSSMLRSRLRRRGVPAGALSLPVSFIVAVSVSSCRAPPDPPAWRGTWPA